MIGLAVDVGMSAGLILGFLIAVSAAIEGLAWLDRWFASEEMDG